MAARNNIAPIVKTAENLCVALHCAVDRFPARDHRYGVGKLIKDKSLACWSLANRAIFDAERRPEVVARLKWTVDDLKLTMTLAKRLRAFNGKREFVPLALLAEQLGQQAGGWCLSVSPSVQNAQAGRGHVQRDEKLSIHAASRRGAKS